MASLQDSTLDLDEGLRQSYAFQIRSQERETLGKLLGSILELSREARLADIYPEPSIYAELAAVARDLRFAEAYLQRVWGYEDEHSPALWHARLAVKASQVGPKVGELAGELEGELAAVASEAVE